MKRMKFYKLNVICILLFPGLCMAYPTFYSFYDLARPNSDYSSTDIYSHGPTMSGGIPKENGVSFITYRSQWTTDNKAYFETGRSNNNEITVITAISPLKCESSKFLIWALPNSGSGSRCGLACFANYEWGLGCVNSQGNVKLSSFLISPSGQPMVFGVTFRSIDEKLGMNLYLKVKNGTTASLSFVDPDIDYKNFFSISNINYGVYTGVLYYLGFLNEAIDFDTFLRYAGSADPDTKDIKCSNCDGNPESLTCTTGKLKLVSYRTREYFCECPKGSMFDAETSTCTLVSTQCSLPCPNGCSSKNKAKCIMACPNNYVLETTYGDYITCKCQKGFQLDSNNECINTMVEDESNNTKIIIISVFVPIAVISVIVIVICMYRKYCQRTQPQQLPLPQPFNPVPGPVNRPNDSSRPEENRSMNRDNVSQNQGNCRIPAQTTVLMGTAVSVHPSRIFVRGLDSNPSSNPNSNSNSRQIFLNNHQNNP